MPGKIRLGFIADKGHDPIPVGTQDRAWPEKFKKKNNSGPKAAGWGGQFHIDVAVPLRVGRLHPDIFEIDLMGPKDISLARLQKNHINFNLGHDYIDAHNWGPKHSQKIRSAFEPRSNNLYPEWKQQDFIYRKDVYMKALDKAGIPIVPTHFVYGHFDAKKVLKEVQTRGWDKFFVKPGDFGAYSGGCWHGKTDECVRDMTSLLKYQNEDAPSYKVFLVQPYMLKPDGKVFDEVRNFFVDGEWKYSVYTDGTDDDAVWTQPPGAVQDATKALAQRAYAQFLRVVKWRGKSFVPPFTRIDIGMIPDKKCPGKVRVFVNEIEQEPCTWLVRYCPFNLLDLMGEVYVRKAKELLEGRIAAGEKIENKARVLELLGTLGERTLKQVSSNSLKRKLCAEQGNTFADKTAAKTQCNFQNNSSARKRARCAGA